MLDNLICKLKGHKIHLVDFIKHGLEYQFCTRCGWKNFRIDDNGLLIKTEEQKEFKLG